MDSVYTSETFSCLHRLRIPWQAEKDTQRALQGGSQECIVMALALPKLREETSTQK